MNSSLDAETPVFAVANAPSPSTLLRPVVSVERLPTPVDVYDIAVEGEREFFANGVLVHNCDELAKYRYAQELWDQLKFGMRMVPADGRPPQIFISTTPKPIEVLKKIIAHARCMTVVRSTYDNLENLAPEFIEELRNTYEGTSLGQQEIHAAILDEAKGALWRRDQIERTRITKEPDPSFWKRTAIGLDPQAGKGRSETGIIAVSEGGDGHGYVRADASDNLSPDAWAQRVWQLYQDLDADIVVAEGNQGGEMVRHTLESISKKMVITKVTARHAKQARAEPVAALYEQSRIHHIGTFGMLESQMVTWEPESGQASPDRIDALVWACRHLFVGHQERRIAAAPIIVTA